MNTTGGSSGNFKFIAPPVSNFIPMFREDFIAGAAGTIGIV